MKLRKRQPLWLASNLTFSVTDAVGSDILQDHGASICTRARYRDNARRPHDSAKFIYERFLRRGGKCGSVWRYCSGTHTHRYCDELAADAIPLFGKPER